MKSNNAEVFKTIMNPSTGKMVQSGGQLGKKIIKDYRAETIYNPLTRKQVKTGGSVGKKVLGMYRAKGGESCKVDGIDVTLCNIANLPVVKDALKNEREKKSKIEQIQREQMQREQIQREKEAYLAMTKEEKEASDSKQKLKTVIDNYNEKTPPSVKILIKTILKDVLAEEGNEEIRKRQLRF